MRVRTSRSAAKAGPTERRRTSRSPTAADRWARSASRWVEPDQGVAEVGYWVAAEARGRGLCTRAVRLVSRWVLADCGGERLQLRADEQNVASRKVAENAGFTQEGILRSSRYNARLGRRVDFVMYSLLPGELSA